MALSLFVAASDGEFYEPGQLEHERGLKGRPARLALLSLEGCEQSSLC